MSGKQEQAIYQAANQSGPGGPGDDHINNGDKGASVHGEGGDDNIYSYAGESSLYGDDGNDVLHTVKGGNYLSGGDGNDSLVSDSQFIGLDYAADTFSGGAGDDELGWSLELSVLESDLPVSVFDGSDGVDTLDFTPRGGDAPYDHLTISIGGDPGVTLGGAVIATLSSIERLNVFTGSSDVKVIGGGLADRVQIAAGENTAFFGRGGDDVTYSRGLSDTIYGGSGSDSVDISLEGHHQVDLGGARDTLELNFYQDVAAHASRLDGGTGEDQLRVVLVNAPFDTMYDAAELSGSRLILDGKVAARFENFEALYVVAGRHTLTFSGLDGNDTVRGSDVSDTLAGQGGDDRLRGGDYGDLLSGGQGADRLVGGKDADTLIGGADADTLIGGAGGDSLEGNAGADVFVFSAAKHSTPELFDAIADFAQGLDRIDLSALDADAKADGLQHLTFIGDGAFSGAGGELRYEIADGHTTLMADVHGSQTQLSIQLMGEISFVEGDFIL